MKKSKIVRGEFFKFTHLFFLQCLVAPIANLHIFHRPIKSLCCCFIDCVSRAVFCCSPPAFGDGPPGGLLGTSHLGWAEFLLSIGMEYCGRGSFTIWGLRPGASCPGI